MKISDIVIEFLESKGIEHVFVVSGGGCIHLVDSLGKSKLNYICMHHEQGTAMAAEGYARIKNDVAACLVTTGPGGTNALTGVLGCWLDSIPTIFISGQVSLSQIARGTGCRQIGDQEFDIISTVKSMTKYCKMIENKNEILYELNKAYDIAKSGRPGPVWLDIPLDIQGASVEEHELIPVQSFIEEQPDIQESDLLQFKTLLEKSKRPLIVCGNGVRLSNSVDLLNIFIKSNEIPALTGVHSGVDCLDNTYDYYAGRIGLLGNLSSNKIVQEADLLIVLGSRLNVKMTGYDPSLFAPNAKKIFVDIDTNEIDKHKFNIDLKINSDLNVFLNTILKEQYKLEFEDWREYVRTARSEQKYVYPKHINLKSPASAYYFLYLLQNYMKDLPIITSNGTAHVATLQTIQLKNKQRMFTNVGCASMGYGLPAAIGASFALNKSPVICIEGDGSLQMNIQELQTLVHHKLPVVMVVINNDGYISIKITQQNFFGGYEVASGKESGVSFPSLEKLSDAYGIEYHKITRNSEIDNVLFDIFSSDISGPIICEVFTHPNEKHEPKVIHRGIDKDGKIIPGDLTNMFISETFDN